MFGKLERGGAVVTLLGLMAGPALAQTVVTGVVRREKSDAIADVSLQIRGTTVSVMSNADGRYRLEIPRAIVDTTDSVTIVARHIGFDPLTRRVATRRGPVTADFALRPATLQLEALVVSGTAGPTDPGKPSRAKDIAASVVAPASAPPREMRDAPVASADRVSVKATKATKATKASPEASRVRRGGATTVAQEPSPGVLTAAVWDDAAHWPEYTRFLGRASENAWNPWGLEVGQPEMRPLHTTNPPRSPRRALDLGFLVDATGSMGDEMTFLKSELKDIVRRVRATEPELDIRLSVVFYRDRGDVFLTKAQPFTRNAEDAVSFIGGTTADGGGDFPEDMNAGLDVMMRQAWSTDAIPQMLFLLADAPPHQYPGEDYTYHEAIRDAAAKGIAIYPVAASGVDKPTEFLFRAMAVMTGGKYVFLTDDSGVGDSHETPDITGYTVEKLNDLMVREIRAYVATHSAVQRKVAESR